MYERLRRMATALSPRARLLLVLHWLRDYPKLSLLRDVYHVSTTYISQDIHHIVPILYSSLRGIQWPAKWIAGGRFGTHGKLDCTVGESIQGNVISTGAINMHISLLCMYVEQKFIINAELPLGYHRYC